MFTTIRSARRSRLLTFAIAGAVASSFIATTPANASTDEPKNIIFLISDGMGYNQVDLASAYQYGTTNHQVTVDPSTGAITRHAATPSQVYQNWDVEVGQSTYNATGEYDPDAAWSDFNWVYNGFTDSAAAGTALGTGVKTDNGVLGYDPDGNRLENITERASALGKATGVVTSVPYSHATPAGYAAHNLDRWDLPGVTTEYIDAGLLDVVIGGGHPYYNDDNELLDTPVFDYVTQQDWNRLNDGQTRFELVEEKADFEAIANGSNIPDALFGAVQVASTLQQNRTGAVGSALPFDVPANEVPDLATLSKAALNVLDNASDEGFFVMIEGGAIDWSGHANDSTTAIEEQVDFNLAVEAVAEWVETNSSWDETLVVVTADHECGYLAGPGANPNWTPISGSAGQVPAVSWHSGNHTNQLVPVYAHGAGSQAITARATNVDPVRGAYVDNTDLGKLILDDLWTQDAPSQGIPLIAEVSGTGAGGPGGDTGTLALSVADFGDGVEFDQGRNAGTHLRYRAALPTVTVTDSRPNSIVGNGGWSVTGQASDLTSGSRSLRAHYLGWSTYTNESKTGVTPGGEAATYFEGGTGLSQSATLASADSNGRLGSIGLGADLRLDIPVDTQEGRYTGDLSVSLFPVD